MEVMLNQLSAPNHMTVIAATDRHGCPSVTWKVAIMAHIQHWTRWAWKVRRCALFKSIIFIWDFNYYNQIQFYLTDEYLFHGFPVVINKYLLLCIRISDIFTHNFPLKMKILIMAANFRAAVSAMEELLHWTHFTDFF